jgi:hypothetical protein
MSKATYGEKPTHDLKRHATPEQALKAARKARERRTKGGSEMIEGQGQTRPATPPFGMPVYGAKNHLSPGVKNPP